VRASYLIWGTPRECPILSFGGSFSFLSVNPMSHWVGSFLIDEGAPPKISKSILIAESADDLRTIGELRYSLYIDRDRKAYPCADHRNGCFVEPVDQSSLNIFDVSEGACVTAIRLTKAHLAVDDQYLRRLLAHSPFDASSCDRLTVVSRLVAAEHAEARSLMMSARPSPVPFFTPLGFVSSGHSYAEAIGGEMVGII